MAAKTQRFNLTVQRLLKLCPGFARCQYSNVFDLRGALKDVSRDLRHVRFLRQRHALRALERDFAVFFMAPT